MSQNAYKRQQDLDTKIIHAQANVRRLENELKKAQDVLLKLRLKELRG